jgi:tetratricopeptide (TPR) repeat protein
VIGKKKKELQAIWCLFTLLCVIFNAQSAHALLPPHGPTFATPDANDNASANLVGHKRKPHHNAVTPETAAKTELFLLHSNPVERIEAQVQISTLNDKISHLEDPGFIVPDVDSKKYSPELIQRAITMIRMHYLGALLTERGTLLAVVGETDKAIADLGAALDSDNKNFHAYNNRACLKAYEGDFDGALADANKALSLSPDFAEALDTRGTVYLAQGQLQKAATDLNRAISTKPQYAEAFYHRSLVMKALGKETASAEDMKKAKELGYIAADQSK